MSLSLSSFEKSLKESLTEFSSPSSEHASELMEAIHYSLLSPGKRIRAQLVQLVSSLLQVPEAAALPTALSIEMLHCFTLIHDDLPCMDNSDFRRGMPSNHKRFSEPLALLAGDALIFMAFEVFQKSASTIEANRWIQGFRRLCQTLGPLGVIGGQARELSLSSSEVQLSELMKIHEMKTGALFEASILIPFDFSGISADSLQAKALFLFARELGKAFQIADDLEDRLEDHHGTQKPMNFLFYPGSAEVIEQSLKGLEQAHQSLEKQWGTAARSLILLSSGIAERISTQRIH